MKKTLQRIAAAAALTLWAVPALAQTADEVIEKHLAATGGRAALSKLTSRVSSGSIALTTPVGELKGDIEVYSKKPNKTRTVIKLDLTALGGGQMTSDQRFDGVTGYVIDTLQGNREVTGDPLEVMKSASFPTPLLTYKEAGSSVVLSGREKAGAADVFVIQYTPKTGIPARLFIDAESFMLVKTILTVNVPQLGGPIEQVVEFSDFRDVDGIKVPYVTKSTNPVQTISSTATTIKHNVEIDDSSFSKPAGQ